MKKNKIKAIAFDMDGTLLNDAKEISPRTRESFEALKELGLYLILATGRSFEALEPYKMYLDLQYPVICYNGARIVSGNGKIIKDHLLEDRISKYIINFARKEKVHIQIYRNGKLFFEKRTPEAEFYENHVNLKGDIVNFDKLDSLGLTKIMYLGDHEYLVTLAGAIKENFGQDLSVMFSNPMFLEFMPGGVSKGNSLSELADYLGIGLENIMAFGDGENDISMIKTAGIGIAMSNANTEVKEFADLVTLSNNEDGVAEVLEDYFGLV